MQKSKRSQPHLSMLMPCSITQCQRILYDFEGTWGKRWQVYVKFAPPQYHHFQIEVGDLQNRNTRYGYTSIHLLGHLKAISDRETHVIIDTQQQVGQSYTLFLMVIGAFSFYLLQDALWCAGLFTLFIAFIFGILLLGTYREGRKTMWALEEYLRRHGGKPMLTNKTDFEK